MADPKKKQLPERAVATAKTTVNFKKGEWWPMPAKDLLRRVCIANIANHTGKLDYLEGGTAAGSGLESVVLFFCDNVLFNVAVPDYHTEKADETKDDRSLKYSYFGNFTKKIFKILDETKDENGELFIDRSKTKVKCDPANLRPMPKVDVERIKTIGFNTAIFDYQEHNHHAVDTIVPQLKPDGKTPEIDEATGKPTTIEQKATVMRWQGVKMAVPDANLGRVISLVKTGVFAKEKIYLKDFDATTDCKGTFRRREVFKFLVDVLGFRIRKQNYKWSNNTVLDNEIDVGLNCITWMTSIDGYRVRLKLYLKLPQELEKASVRSKMGQHIHDWLCEYFTRLAEARDATTEEGLTRAEITVYFDNVDREDGFTQTAMSDFADESELQCTAGQQSIQKFDFDTAHNHLKDAVWMESIVKRALSILPAKLVYHTPHRVTVANWVRNIKHTLIVYDTFYNMGIVAYGYNEVTHALSCFHVRCNWQEKSSFVMQHLPVAGRPIDVIALHRGAYKLPPPQPIPPEVKSALAILCKSHIDRDHFNYFVDADYDLDGVTKQQLTMDAFCKPTAEEVDDDAEDEEDEGGGYGRVQFLQQQETLDEEKEPDEEPEADAEADPEGDVNDVVPDGNDVCVRSVVSVVIPKKSVSDGGIEIEAVRFHRFAKDRTEELITRFPKKEVGDRFAYHKHVPKDHPTLTAAEHKTKHEEAAAENREIADRQLVTSGFRLEGLRPNETLCTELPVHAQRPTAKIERNLLLDCESVLELQLNCIKPAVNFNFFLQLQHTNTKIRGAITRLREALRKSLLESRLLNVAEGVAERPTLQAKLDSVLQVVDFKSFLVSNSSRLKSLGNLEPGDYPVVAIRQLSKPKGSTDAYLPHHIFLKIPKPKSTEAETTMEVEGEKAAEAETMEIEGEETETQDQEEQFVVTAFASEGNINMGILRNAETMRPHLYRGEKEGDFYLSDQLPSTDKYLGTLTRGKAEPKKRKQGDEAGEGKLRSDPDSALVVDDVRISLTKAQQNEELSRAAENLRLERAKAVAESTPGASAPDTQVPALGMETEEKTKKGKDGTEITYRNITKGKQIKNIVDAFPKALHSKSGLHLKVLAMDNPVEGEYNGKKNPTVLMVQNGDEESVLVYATPKIKAEVDNFTTGCVLDIKTWTKVDVNFKLLGNVTDWSPPHPSKYAEINAIAKGVPENLQVITIDSVRLAKDSNYEERVIFKDTEGRIWRFKYYHHSAKLTIQPGYGINVPAWTTVAP